MSSNQSKDKKDIALKSMQKYLLSGAQMLQDSCPNCNIPLLKYKNRIFCSNCGKDAVYVDSTEEIKAFQEANIIKNSEGNIFGELNAVLLGKLSSLTHQLASETDSAKISLILLPINQIVEIFQSLKQLTDQKLTDIKT